MNPLAWFRSLSRLAQLALAIWAFLFVRGIFAGSAAVRAKLGTEQAGAAMQSGRDAVNTVGAAQRRDTATDRKVEGTRHEVDNATDAAGADRAGRDGLCVNFGICADD